MIQLGLVPNRSKEVKNLTFVRGCVRVRLRVRELNSLVFSLSTTVLVWSALPFEAFQTFSASRRMCVSHSTSGMSSGKVSQPVHTFTMLKRTVPNEARRCNPREVANLFSAQ